METVIQALEKMGRATYREVVLPKAYYRSLPDAAYEFAAQIRKGVQS